MQFFYLRFTKALHKKTARLFTARFRLISDAFYAFSLKTSVER